MPRALVLTAHPSLHLSVVNRALHEAALAVAGGDGGIEVRDLYALYPDYLIDVSAEQAAVERADLLVWLHPTQWYSMPALMKLWVDEVLAYGWAYGHSGKRLHGKDLWLVTSTGGRQSAYRPSGYNRYFFEAFLHPYEQTAALCGLRFLPPLVLHGALRVSEAELAGHVGTFIARLQSYPDWPELENMEECPVHDVPEQDRPQDAS
jgi:glutathione-regulated potassium-efflux system ancillary protein KefF